jgi:hypothetical protein
MQASNVLNELAGLHLLYQGHCACETWGQGDWGLAAQLSRPRCVLALLDDCSGYYGCDG